jgi:hypothetical protein
MVSSSAVLDELVCIGSGSTIAEGTTVSRAVIGRGCRIGSGVRIHNSFLMANVRVSNSAFAKHPCLLPVASGICACTQAMQQCCMRIQESFLHTLEAVVAAGLVAVSTALPTSFTACRCHHHKRLHRRRRHARRGLRRRLRRRHRVRLRRVRAARRPARRARYALRARGAPLGREQRGDRGAAAAAHGAATG